jgi:tetraacyldisaccharide 4'-kinase
MGEHAPVPSTPAQAKSASAPAPTGLAARLSARLQRSWVQRDWLSVLLLDVSWLYGNLVRLRRWLYAKAIFESDGVAVPVIVVGNVVAGGAGKTPVAIEIVKYLKAQGWQPGVVSRGYGRTLRLDDVNDSGFLAVTASTPVEQSGDEPALIHKASEAPVFVAKERIVAARALLAAHPGVNVIVCDDGLQHLALQRDIEICVFDQRGTGNGWLQPAGPLREPWPRKVDFVLQTATTFGEPAPTDNPTFTLTRQLAPYALRSDGSRVHLSDLKTRPLCALAAIAQPEAFFSMLRAHGLQPATTLALPDHYNFNSWLRPIDMDCTLICTEKDAVKLWPLHPDTLAVPLLVDIPAAFFTALAEKLSSPHGHQTT